MPHIPLPKDAPGIVGPMLAYPETGKALRGLAEALLRGPSSLTPGERELIAAFVSSRNSCMFCMNSHAGAARELLPSRSEVDAVIQEGPSAAKTEKMRCLLQVADQVWKSGKSVTAEAIQQARKAGADDKAIHDTVLIAAAFCMFNRYVDGLGTTAPTAEEAYVEMGKMLATQGYIRT